MFLHTLVGTNRDISYLVHMYVCLFWIKINKICSCITSVRVPVCWLNAHCIIY